jgi:penicillin-binding protein 1A
VPFLFNAFGIEMAARTYFDKSAEQLDVLEAATLIGMLKGTAAYNPCCTPSAHWRAANLVLAQMARRGKLEPPSSRRWSSVRCGDFERQVEPPGSHPTSAAAQMADRLGGRA